MDTGSKVLIDTNILVYAKDSSDKVKQQIAIDFISMCGEQRIGALSIQILAEFSSVLQGKAGLSSHDINEAVRDLSLDFDLLYYSKTTIIMANEIAERFGLDFFDALIAATMQENNVTTIATENEKHFKLVPWLKVMNPFKRKDG